MNKDEAYDLMDQNNIRLVKIMKISGWLDIGYGLLAITIGIAVFGIFSILAVQGLTSCIFGCAVLYRNHCLDYYSWPYSDTLLFLTIINLFFGFFVASLLMFYGYGLRKQINELWTRVENGEYKN